MTPPSARPRILLADDHQVLLDGLRSLLEPDFEVVGTVQDGRSLLEAADALRPDAVVCDVSMPLMNGIEAVRRLAAKHSGMKLIILTMHLDRAFLYEALEAGAAGYVVKHSAAEELSRAISQVLQGEQYISESLRRLLTKPPPLGAAQPRAEGLKLGQRQREVLQLLAEGHSVKDAAWRLGVSVKTIEYHKYRIMNKLNFRSTAELVRFAVRHGIISAS